MKSTSEPVLRNPVLLPTLLALLVLALLAGTCATPAAPVDGSVSETGSDASNDDPAPEPETAMAMAHEEFLKPDARSVVIVFWRPDNIGIYKTVQLYTDLNLARFINQNSIQQIKVPAGPLVLLAKART